MESSTPTTPRLPCPRPARVALEGRYVRLEPFEVARHAAGLWQAASGPGAEARFEFLADPPPRDLDDMTRRVAAEATRDDPLAFAVVDRDSDVALGRQSLMRIEPAHGVIEIGSVLWGPRMSRSRRSTEALQLAASYVFDALGYRRFEWKCNNANEPSKRAAERFGFTFEGIFRQHMIIKGENRDTAWFSMLNGEWPTRKAGFLRWLDPANFDEAGNQKTPLSVR